MTMEIEMESIKYRVYPMTRYLVVREYSTTDGDGDSGGGDTLGEYDNERVAHEAAYAVCRQEHERLGWAVGDERITYPVALERTEGACGQPAPGDE